MNTSVDTLTGSNSVSSPQQVLLAFPSTAVDIHCQLPTAVLVLAEQPQVLFPGLDVHSTDLEAQ